MRWHREEYLAHLVGEGVGREMFVELFGLLVGLDEEWRAQGASEAEIEMHAFGWDFVERAHLPLDLGPVTGLEEKVLEDSVSHRLVLDSMGRRMMLPKGKATIPLPQNHPLAGPDEWPLVRSWFSFSPSRVDAVGVGRAIERQRDGAVLRLTLPGAYATMRELMGDENACLAFIEEPHLVEELLGALGELCERAFSQLPADAIPDELFIHEDFAGKSGPIIGPETFRRFVTPYYKRISECWVSRGVAIFDVDSDGFIEPVLDAMIEAGVNCVHPLEPAAGTDMVRLRKRYGRRLVLRGGIDKFSLMRGRDAIRAELEYKMQPIMRGGGVMFGLDHRIPNGTPLEAYRFYVETGRAILGLPPIDSSSRGWARMA